MGLFENLGRKVEEFKQQAEKASEEQADYECADCGALVYGGRDDCSECGSEDLVPRDRDDGAGDDAESVDSDESAASTDDEESTAGADDEESAESPEDEESTESVAEGDAGETPDGDESAESAQTDETEESVDDEETGAQS